MTIHFNVFAQFDGKSSERSYFVTDKSMARRAALQDGAQIIYQIKQCHQNWLTQQYIGRDYAMLLLRAIVFQVDAGVPAVKAVQTAIESEDDPNKRSRLQGAIDALVRGASLSDALYATGLYDTTVKSILAASERMGGGSAIVSALEYMENRKAAWKTYGVILSAIGIELSTAFSVPPAIQWYAIPWIRENLPKSSPIELEQYSLQLDSIAFGNMLWMWFSFAMLVTSFVLIGAWLIDSRARDWLTHNLLVKIPLVGIWYTNEALSRSCKVFASMLKAGVRMNDAMQTIIRSTGNAVAKRFWVQAYDVLNTGATHGVAFASSGLLRKDEILVLKSAQGNVQIARAFNSMSNEREWRQKLLSARIFRMSVMLMLLYIGITLLIGFRLFELFNAGLDMSLQTMTKGI